MHRQDRRQIYPRVNAMNMNEMVPALGKLPSGLFVLTIGAGDDVSGMLASWVQQCSFDPPAISVALKPERHIAAKLSVGTPFVLNQLADHQTQLLAHFGRGFGPGEAAFVGIDNTASAAGPPIVTAALAHLSCVVAERISAGDHDVVIGRVTEGQVHSDGNPYVHIRKSGLNY